MPSYQMPDGNSYEFESDQQATEALQAWEKQFNTKPSLGEKTTDELVSDLASMGTLERVARLEAGFVPGLVETGVQMATGLPAFITGSLGKFGSMAQGDFSEEGLEKAAEDLTPEILHDITYQPRTYAGQLTSRTLGEAFRQAGRIPAAVGAATVGPIKAALEGTGQTGAQEQAKEIYKTVAPVTQAFFEGGLLAHGGVRAYKHLTTKKPVLTEAEIVQDIKVGDELLAKRQGVKPTEPSMPTEQIELGLEPRFGKYGEIPKEVDEIGMPYNKGRSLEAQLTERGGDLFSKENIQAEAASRFEARKLQEIDAAWKEYKETKPVPEDYFKEPSQGGGGEGSISKRGGGGRGFRQRGEIDKDLLTFGIPALIEAVKARGIPMERLVEKFKGTFKESELKTAIDNSFDPKSRSTLVWMKPQDFLDLATQRKPYERDIQGRLAEVKRGSIRMGLEGVKGLDELPYLMVRNGPEGAAKVIGHEGRHRMDVFMEKGLDLVPVRVQHEMYRWGEKGLSYKKAIPQGEEAVTALDIPIDPIFKPQPLGLTQAGKGQRGSIGFKKEPKAPISFDEYKRSLPEKYWEVADELYKRRFGVDSLGNVPILVNANTKGAMDNIPGLKGLAPVELVPKEEMLQVWKHEPDITSNVIRDALTSGGRMMALRSNSSFINWSVEKVNSAIRETEVISKKAVHDIISASNRLKVLTKTGFKDEALIETLQELMVKEGKEAPLDLKSPTQITLANTIKSSWDSLYKAVNAERAQRGIGPVEYRPNYLTAIFKGPYRGFVRDSSNGNVIGVVAGKTMREAELAVTEISRLAREQKLDVTIEPPTFSSVFSKESFQKNIGAYYVQMNEMMQMMGTESPAGKAFQDIATQWYDRRIRDHLGYRQHFKHKKGVYGAEGNKPWKDIRDNALDMLDAQIDGIQAGWNWVAQQRAARELHDVLNAPETQHLRNATEYVTKYYDNAFHRATKGLDPIRGLIDGVARTFGQDPTPIYEALGLTRNFALVSTLGMSGGFILSQLVQVPQALVASTTFLSKYGLKGNTFGSFYEGLHDFYAAKHKNGTASVEGQYAYDYFSKNGTFDPHLLEKHIPRKIVSTTGMSKFSKALTDGAINGPVWVIEQYSKHLGHISIEMAETATRGTYAMSMFHYLRRAGLTKEHAAKVSDKLTSDFFVDYNPHERAMVFSSMGEIGKFMSTVTTYKINALNQGATFASHKAAKAFAAATLVLVGLSGITGIPGFDEIEDVFGAMKRHISPDIQTPREYLLKEAPDVLTFGAAASLTDTNLQTKFNQGNVLPDDLSSFIFPLGRIIYNIGESAIDAATNPNKETLGRFAWEMVPGGVKALPEKWAFTDKRGLTLNPRLAGKGQYEEAGVGIRDDSDQVKRALGLTSLKESKAKEVQFMTRRDKEIRDKRLTSHLTKATQAIVLNNPEDIQKHLKNYFSEGGTETSLKNKLEAAMIGRNTELKTRLLLKIKSGTLRQAIEANNLMEYLKD